MNVDKAFFLFVLLCGLGAACGDGGSDESPREELGEAENLYIQATRTLTAGVDTADCALITQLSKNYTSYSEAMTDGRLRGLASSRFKPVLDFMTFKLCNEFQISGDIAAYKSDAIASAPAGEFLNNTPLLRAIVNETSDRDALIEAANEERSTQGLAPIIVSDYYNSVTQGPSTIVFFPGWPGRPKLDQWLQVQRTLRAMFFISLEPRDDGTYSTFLHSRALVTAGDVAAIGALVTDTGGTCLLCHYSGKPLRMRPLDDGKDAAKVQSLVDSLGKYPPRTNHPEYNPFPESPGIGTGGKLTMEEASAYAGRTVTAVELDTLNRNTSCDSCHNGGTQNPLRPPLGETVEMLMANGSMPPGAGVVDPTERAEAVKVMTAAYKVKLQRYFVGE